MDKIIRGTTPTFIYTFNSVTVANIAVAYLTVKQGDEILIEKDLTDATVGQKALSWTFTQAETLSMGDVIKVMLNWRLSDGTRGASAETKLYVTDNHKDEVI